MIELIVVIAIVAILSAVAAPSFVSTTQRFRVMAEMNVFAGDLNFARAEAVKQGLPVMMCPANSDVTDCATTNTWQSGWIVYAFMDSAAPTVKTVLRKQVAWATSNTSNKDTLTGDNSSPYLVTFSRDGFAAAAPTASTGLTTFTLRTTPTNNAATKCVQINKAGRQVTLSYTVGSCT